MLTSVERDGQARFENNCLDNYCPKGYHVDE